MLWCLDHEGVIEPFEAQGGVFLSLYPEIIARQYGLERERLIDFAELWTFVYPLCSVPRTVAALARILKQDDDDEAAPEVQMSLFTQVVAKTFAALIPLRKDTTFCALAAFMSQAHWFFAPALCANLGLDDADILAFGGAQKALRILDQLPKWQDEPVGQGDLGQSITEDEAVRMLTKQLPQNPELRPSQIAYTKAVQKMFSSASNKSRSDDAAHIHLLQAGTGIGKTLGYLASARLWADRNDEPVWISTFSRHLQDQIADEVKRVAPAEDVVIRKGRENYLCLLNYDEMAMGSDAWDFDQRIVLGLIARWMLASHEGILVGADFPLWLEERADSRLLNALRLKQGECIYSACPFYERCYIEKSRYRSRKAKVIIANHALTLRQAIQGNLPYSRLIIDEAHQLFDATDSATRLRLGLYEALELRRWLLGAARSERRRSRRGLSHRLEALSLSEKAMESLQKVLLATQVFGDPEGSPERILENAPIGILEEFFHAIVQDMNAADNGENPLGFSLEAPLMDAQDTPLKQMAEELHQQIERLYQAMLALIKALQTMLDEVGDSEISEHRQIVALLHSLEEYPLQQLHGWLYLLARLLGKDPQAANENTSEGSKSNHPAVIERMYMQPRTRQRRFEVGLEMVFRDPTEILQNWLYAVPQKAVLLTSASLGVNPQAIDWKFAHRRTGVQHLIKDSDPETLPAQEVFISPFDYPKQSRILVATDVDIYQAASVHAAMQACFIASCGGALGLFTAIHRAKTCYGAIAKNLRDHDIPLYSQHNDQAGNMLLGECMRQQENACLLATDAFRDGVDIPGNALRLVVMDRLPWARPDLIHRHRKSHFGKDYNHEILGQRLLQGFGRLIRSAEDQGAFVLLDQRLPSSLEQIFPIPVERLPIAEIIKVLSK